MICASCGTSYEPPASGVPYCPNNNCPLHYGTSAGGARGAIDVALREADMWAQAVTDAEAHLTDVRAQAAAAKARVIAQLEAAKAQAAADAAAIAKAADDFGS